MLAAVFISGGIDTLRRPAPRVAEAQAVAPKVARALGLPVDTDQLVKVNAAAQIGAGALLAIGRLPRLAATLLAASLVPTTMAGHRFWDEDDPATRAQQRIHFLKNLGLLGGLILAAVDTEGAPSVAWLTRRATRRAAGRARHAIARGYQSLPAVSD